MSKKSIYDFFIGLLALMLSLMLVIDIFINIPNDYFIKVVYSLQGNCKLIGKGTNGRFRENISYKSPALVVEATGTCTIAWEGTRSDGTIVRGEYRYTDYDNVISIKKG